jgi:hypothetical protein
MAQELHRFIVQRECRNNGWQTGRWKAGFAKAAKADPRFAGEFAESENNGDEIWGDIPTLIPDAWRVVVEGPETEGKNWGCPVMVLEFLEVEIGHPIPFEKHRNYVHLWWRFDGTGCFHFRVYRIGRHGPAALWLDTETAHQDIAITYS